MPDTIEITHAFLSYPAKVHPVGERVAYSWACEHTDPAEHVIRCLLVWHDCDHSLDEARRNSPAYPEGWKMTGVNAHDLIAAEPLHIEASVYWPGCCGLHGFIRNGEWVGA